MPPRPRPYTIVTPSSAALVKSSTSDIQREKLKVEEEAEDALFIRNRGRSIREVNKRVARAVADAKASSSPSSSGTEDEGEEDNSNPAHGQNRRKHAFSTGKAQALPKWAKKGAIQDLLGDSDSDVENKNTKYDRAPSDKRHPEGSRTGTPSGRSGKRAWTRSRSRSLTPPPDLTEMERLRAQIAIQRALDDGQDNASLRPSVIEIDEDEDGGDVGETTLDPELQHIAQAIRDRVSKQKANNNLQGCAETSHDIGVSAVVNITVKWVHHPEDHATPGRLQRSWSFTVKRHDTLKALALQVSKKAQILPNNLVLMHEGKQVFTSVIPDELGLWDQGVLEACDRKTFDALRLRHFRSPTPTRRGATDTAPDYERFPAPSVASEERDDTDNKFKLVLRASTTSEITLSVRPTTTCGKIVRAFLAVAAKHGNKVPVNPDKARLYVDGEKQDPDTPISDCGLEDGDMVEVMGM